MHTKDASSNVHDVSFCLSYMSCNLFEILMGPWLSSHVNELEDSPIKLKIFLQRLVHRSCASNVYDSIYSEGSLIKLNIMSNLIKVGNFNLSTMLNLKTL